MNRHSALVILMVLVVLGGAWDWGWKPLSARRAELLAEIERARALNKWVRENLGAARLAAGRRPDAAGLAQASQTIQRSVRRFEIAPSVTRIEPRDDRINITLEGAPFDTTVKWLSHMQVHDGLQVISLAMVRGAESGTVDGQLALGAIGR
ncbi:MAG: type II secretion system protein M [Chromatiales bacterium]|jgi:general secretion pathway protein M|nr:type II secretion system protein M [Chromatiales bacterium]